MKLGIMQGRLLPPEDGRFQSFPRDRWREEFALAAAAGLDTIEWIYDAYGEDVNPLATAAGLDELRNLSRVHGVAVESVCADWFMEYPLNAPAAVAAERWQRLDWLMERGAALGINRIVLPFVDASAITTSEQLDAVAHGLESMTGAIESTRVELHLETSLPPSGFAALLARVPHAGIKVNYDSGNSASLGYRPREEFQAYGPRVGSVHLKDRLLGAGTVPLGSGDTDFAGLFEALSEVRYGGDFILQVARGAAGDELAWSTSNARQARSLLQALDHGQP